MDVNVHIREMQAAAAVSMLHTEIHGKIRERERVTRVEEKRKQDEEAERVLQEEYSHTTQLNRMQLAILTNQINSQRTWLENKEVIRRKPLTDVEKLILRARARIKCWPSFLSSLNNELAEIQTELLPHSEDKVAEFCVLIKSTLTKCDLMTLSSERKQISDYLSQNEKCSDVIIEEMLKQVEYFSTFLNDHTRASSEADLEALTPQVAAATEEYDAALQSAEPLRETVASLREDFERAMNPVRNELAETILRLAQEVEDCENEQVATIASIEAKKQKAEEDILVTENECVRTGEQHLVVLGQTEADRERIKGLKEEVLRIEAERVKTLQAAKLQRRQTVLQRRVVKALINARKERQIRESAALEERVRNLSMQVAETDARWASDEYVRQRFRRALLRHRLASGGAGVSEGDAVDAEQRRQEQSAIVTEAEVLEAVKELVEEREGGEELDLAEARARVQCRFPFVAAAALDKAVDLDAVFDRAFEEVAAAAQARTAKGGAGREAHVRALLNDYGVGAEEMAGMGLEELERMLEAEQGGGEAKQEAPVPWRGVE